MSTSETTRKDLRRSRIQILLCMALIVVCLALMLLSSPLVSVGTWNECDVDTFGWLFFVMGGAMRWWSALYRKEGERPRLATTGPYSICRHPAQIGNLLFCISLACFLSSVTCLVGFVIAACVSFSLTIPAEERRLAERFGRRYAFYCRRVPRFWPRFRLFRTTENITIDIGTLIGELRRTAVWMWLPAIGMVAAQCRAEAWWPHFFGLP